MRNTVLTSAALALLASLCGCSSGPSLPKYVEPKLDDAHAAVVEGSGGTYVKVVDNMEAPGSGFVLNNWGGNTIRLAPGKHTLSLENTTSNGTRNTMVTNVARGMFTYDFKAGHKYVLSPKSLFNGDIWIKDKTDGTEQFVAKKPHSLMIQAGGH